MRKSFLVFILLVFCGLSVALPVGAQNILPNPLAKMVGGLGNATVVDVVFAAFKGFAGLFALFAFGFLIISGFKLIMARDNPQALTSAKEGITWSVGGFVVALLAYSLVAAAANFLGSTGTDELANPNVLTPPIKDTGFADLFKTVVRNVLGLAFTVALLMLVYGGYLFIFSAGNEQRVTSGKTVLKWAVAGMLVILLAYSILSGINRILT